MQRINDVDKYISGAPEGVRKKLQQLREAIKSVAPEATEKISYGMPYYSYHGRLAYFAYFKNHIGLYAMHGVLDDYAKEVQDFRAGAATLRFPLGTKLPILLIKKLIRATAKKNENK